MTDPGMSDAAVIEATGRDWAAWKAHLDAAGAAGMDHGAIVRSLEGDIARGWWRQMVAVGFERMIGRRKLGQTCAGDFSASASKTFAGNMDAARGAWCALVEERTDFAGAAATGEPRLTESEKWRYWKVDLDDGSRVSLNFYDKPGGKSTIGVNHDKLGDGDRAAEAKAFWKGLLAEI